MRFGISTHLYHDRRLSREHLAEIASYGFEAVEVFATRSHFDYHDPAAIDRLAGWLQETGLALHGVHAPITSSLSPAGEWGPAISNAVSDARARDAAVREADAALAIIRRIPAGVFVLHLGTPTVQGGENNRAAAFRSAAEIGRLAEAAGTRLAVEVIPNDLSDARTLVGLIEGELEGVNAGICLDFGHAFLMGDVPDIIEAVSEHLITTHVHDNDRTKDDHRVPFDGRIDWNSALMTMSGLSFAGAGSREAVQNLVAGGFWGWSHRSRGTNSADRGILCGHAGVQSASAAWLPGCLSAPNVMRGFIWDCRP